MAPYHPKAATRPVDCRASVHRRPFTNALGIQVNSWARPLTCIAQVVRIILAKNWWSLLIRGAAAIVLGIVAVVWRDISLGSLILIFFGFALLDGVIGLAGAVRAAEARERWAPLLVEAIIGIAAALLAVTWPGFMTLNVLIYIISAWALLTGLLEIASGVLLRKHVRGEWLLAVSGFASLLLCVLMASLPLASPGGSRALVGRVCISFWRPAHRPEFPSSVVGEIGVGGLMTVLANSPVIHSASLAHGVWDRRPAEILLDALLVLVGIAASISICRSFMDWLSGPPDSAAMTAMAILVGSIMSLCWSLRYVLLGTILSPPRTANQRKPEEH